MDQVSLNVSENGRKAMDFAFEEAQNRLTSMNQSFDPFTVTVVDAGLEVNDHPAETATAVRESVKMLLAQDMPEAYALCYDGWCDTDDGRLDALIVEVADRGSEDAYTLALMYSMVDGEYAFETDYGYAGPVAPLYPAGTKPIVSGLAALQAEDADQAAEDGSAEEPSEVDAQDETASDEAEVAVATDAEGEAEAPATE